MTDICRNNPKQELLARQIYYLTIHVRERDHPIIKDNKIGNNRVAIAII